MAATIQISNTSLSKLPGAPGKSINGEGSGLGGKNSSFELYNSPGSYSIPISGDQGVIVTIGENRIIIATNDYSFSLNIQTGDHVAYSRDSSGTVKCYTWHKNTGEVKIYNDNGNYKLNKNGDHEFSDGTTSAVKFDELKQGFDQLVQNLNTELASISASIAGVGGTYVPVLSSANIDQCEVSGIKFP